MPAPVRFAPRFPLPSRKSLAAPLPFVLLLGLYLSIQGYHSRDGDQAYRLPLLLHRQDPSLFATDPFVRAFDAFNPHRGYLALLEVASRPLGLSAALFGLFALTFAATALGISRLARSAWAGASGVGVVAVGLVLLDRAGNIGTNHLFDGMLLDRLIGLGLGWLALAGAVDHSGQRLWLGAGAIGLAALVHPSLGLQLAALAGAGWVAWAIWKSRTGVGWRAALTSIGLLALALLPAAWLHGGGGAALLPGLSREDFLLLSASVQSPQHMLPHLWRRPQWLAWGATMLLAGLSLVRGGNWTAARTRLAVLLAIDLIALGVAWVAVERVHDLRITLFQPFRMATVARGLAMVLLAGHVRGLWIRGDLEGKVRATLLAAGLTGDWTLVVVTLAELATAATERLAPRLTRVVGFSVLGGGVAFLSRHDTESGHVTILAALAGSILYSYPSRRRPLVENPRRLAWATAAAWAVPLAALAAPALPGIGQSAIADALVGRCRFGERPTDDLERLALWCRENTPADARFIGPPGPKTFRLWSRRSVAFNRAGSPYHAAGLADWSARFRDHVGFQGSTADFARQYLTDRQGLERRYQALSDEERAALAIRQGATHVLSTRQVAEDGDIAIGPLEWLRSEGRYAVYRLRSADSLATRLRAANPRR